MAAYWLSFVVAFLGGSVAPKMLAQPESAKRCAPDHLIVKFKTEARQAVTGFAGTNELNRLAARLHLPADATLVETTFGKWQKQVLGSGTGAPELAKVDSNRHLYLRIPKNVSASDYLTRLKHHPLIEYVEPDWLGHAALTIPNDPNFSNQWHHFNTVYTNGAVRADIHTPEAWDITRGSTNVIVALLDTGLNDWLPEFAGRVVPGYNFIDGNDNTADDSFPHGTIIASLLAADANNGWLIAGVDWFCRLMPLKVIRPDDSVLAGDLADAIDWATAHHCKILNMPLALDGYSETVERSLSNAVAHGLIVVGVTDNTGGAITFPGNSSNVIAVGATDVSDGRWLDSGFGPEIALMAPGVNLAAMWGDGSLITNNVTGTSAAAPMVSGVAALLVALQPDLTQRQARTLLCAGADDQVGDPAQDTPGFDIYYGWGRLNAYNSLMLAQTKIERLEVSADGQVNLSWTSPPNGSSKQPFRIECANFLPGPWLTLNSSTITYTTNLATWTSRGPLFTKFFRIRIVVE